MFSKSALYYDLIYSFKNYVQESATIAALIHQHHPQAQTLLDVACGTAEHARHLSAQYKIDGIDLDPTFVKIAQAKNPSGTYSVQDMRAFDLGKTYDVILCLFSSIGYATTLKEVVQALTSFKAHLKPDGLLLVEPWFTPDKWQAGRVNMLTAENELTKICRMNNTETHGTVSRLNFHYLIAEGTQVSYETEIHEMGLFTVEEMKSAFDQAGLVAEHDPEGIVGRGLYLARHKNS